MRLFHFKLNSMTTKSFVFIMLGWLFAFFFLVGCGSKNQHTVCFKKAVLMDKIAGGWAGKMIGVAYGAPTEFQSLGKIIEDSIPWAPHKIENAKWEDDLYVQMTLLSVMDQYGMDADSKIYQKLFATSHYRLWHANAQARKNYYDSIFPPQSGYPEYNFHADDIDFQIEADYIGMICPGMPQLANQQADKIGHIMNYGDGVYGGAFVAAMYAEAFLQHDVAAVIDKALLSLPAESDYYKIVKDVIAWHKLYPDDWKKTWQKLEDKWGRVDICGAGIPYNIDAKLNGAYIVLGLLYGENDVDKTMEISTRCGQDSDCNPSSALGILGVMHGFESFPQPYKDVLATLQDTLFTHTDYTLKKAIKRTYYYIEQHVNKLGGRVADDFVSFVPQQPKALPFEDAFPEVLFDKHILIGEKGYWQRKGHWKNADNALFSNQKGDEISFTFEGTGVSLQGWWVKDGGKADVYVDGVYQRTIDCYYHYGNHEHKDAVIYHVLGLSPGKHVVKLVVKAENRPESSDCKIGLIGAVVFKTGKKVAN